MKKLVIGITAPSSVGLIKGQCAYFSAKGYRVYLLAPRHEKTIKYCKDEGCKLIAVNLKRQISIFNDLISLIHIIYHFGRIRPDIVNVGTPKVSLLGIIAARITFIPKRFYTCRGLRYESETGKLRSTLMRFLTKIMLS